MDLKENTIFIQIASYRDPELLPTIKNCIENAEKPENLRFCICWQHSDYECIDEYINDPRFIILSVPSKLTKGCCWARHKIQQFYTDETYTLQLDSHHRFVEGWDNKLIAMHKGLEERGIQKPLITAYIPSYNPENDPAERVQVPWEIDFDRMTQEGQILFRPKYVDDFKTLEQPIKARFYSAHFAFARGEFCKEVPHDPELYFTGEEMNITLRAYTHGYDLFHPHIVIAWHEYTRKNRVKHWEDDKEWWKKDQHSKKYYTQFIENLKTTNNNNNSNKYGLGTKRSIQDYMKYAKLTIFSDKEYEDEDKDKEEEITIIEKIENNEKDKDKNKEYKAFDQSWRNWIKENKELEISKETIVNILLKTDFRSDEIEKEYNNL